MKQPGFWIVLLIFLADKWWQNQFAAPHIISSYLDDILLIPLCMGAALFIQQVWINSGFTFSNRQIVLTCLFFSITFEGLFPLFIPAYTADFWDIPAYAAGALIFGLILNRKS